MKGRALGPGVVVGVPVEERVAARVVDAAVRAALDRRVEETSLTEHACQHDEAAAAQARRVSIQTIQS